MKQSGVWGFSTKGQNGHAQLVAVLQPRRRRQPVFVNEACKVAVTKLLVDQAAQPVFGDTGAHGKATDGQPGFAPCL